MIVRVQTCVIVETIINYHDRLNGPKYRFINIHLVRGKVCLKFSRLVYLVAQMIASMPTPARARLSHVLRDAQNVCALTKVSTEHCHGSVAVFSFISCWNLYLVPLLVPKMLKWTNRNISLRMVAQRANHNEFVAIFPGTGSTQFEKHG